MDSADSWQPWPSVLVAAFVQGGVNEPGATMIPSSSMVYAISAFATSCPTL